MQAIQVKFLAVTNTRDNRVKAFCQAGELIEAIPCNVNWYDEEYIVSVAKRLMAKLDWNYTITGIGCIKNGDYVVTLAGVAI